MIHDMSIHELSIPCSCSCSYRLLRSDILLLLATALVVRTFDDRTKGRFVLSRPCGFHWIIEAECNLNAFTASAYTIRKTLIAAFRKGALQLIGWPDIGSRERSARPADAPAHRHTNASTDGETRRDASCRPRRAKDLGESYYT